MTIHTTTADENGNFSIALESALVSGETIEITAQKEGQSKSINIQAPSVPYLPNCECEESATGNTGGTGSESSVILTPGFVFDFPATKEVYTALETNAANTFASSDKLEFVNDSWRGMVVRSKVQPTSEDAAAYVAFRFPKKEYLAQASPILWYSTGYYDRDTDEPNYRSSTSLDKGYLTNPNYAFDTYSFDDDYFYLVFKNTYFNQISDMFSTNNFIYKITYNHQEYVLKFDLGYPD